MSAHEVNAVPSIEKVIDLTTALPPSPSEFDEELRATLARLAQRSEFGTELRKNRIGGTLQDRQGGVQWLAGRLGRDLDVERLTVTNGTQSALLLLLPAIVGRGGVLAAESLTYVVLRTLAVRLGIEMVGVALDEEGIVPEHFEQVCRIHKPRALYCNPTVHNPTAAVMSEGRRLQLIEVARRYNVTLIEDDVLGAMHPDAPAPICTLAPDITWYVMSLSKCYAMGLRLAYLVSPSAAATRELVQPVQRLSWWFPNSLSVEIATEWAVTSSGCRVAAALRSETDERQRIAAEMLDTIHVRTARGALHLWIKLPMECVPTVFAEAAERRGVLVRPANLFAIDATAKCDAVRVSLTAPASRQELREGLSIVADLLADVRGS
jgi:DNA-binding transcriptional MocR family regulator